jgi:hypothetical protein
MSLIGNLLTPAAAAGIGRSLALARGANPHGPAAGSFDQHLDLALQAGVGGGAAADASATDQPAPAHSLEAFNGASPLTSIDAFRREHSTAVAQFEDRFLRLLQEKGIDPGEEIVLTTDVHGQVRVASNHPQKEAIERLFHDDVELRNQFLRLDEQASGLRAANLALGLAQWQTEAPDAIASRTQQLLHAGSPPNFSLTVRPQAALTQFNYA